jgi:hypothetical protein
MKLSSLEESYSAEPYRLRVLGQVSVFLTRLQYLRLTIQQHLACPSTKGKHLQDPSGQDSQRLLTFPPQYSHVQGHVVGRDRGTV